ncbi:MAG: helix-turn-helix transcriptional regulator [Actinomycetota bacterium]|nr:helix-turn-helix transcriptional regulator [Actinomycetota bacterium]
MSTITRLRILRESQGLTLDELSRLTGIAPSNLSQIETGKTDPRWSTVMRILDALGIEPSALLLSSGLRPTLGGPRSGDAGGSDPWARLRRKAERGEDVSEEARVLAINTRRRANA